MTITSRFKELDNHEKLVAHLENIYDTVIGLSDRILVQQEQILKHEAEIQALKDTISKMRYWE